MGENNEFSTGDLYLIPEDGGQPIKMGSLITVSEVELESHDKPEPMPFTLCDPIGMHFSLEITGESAKRLKRFLRSTKRYVRRYRQQAKRKSAKERNNSNQTELLS